jgi:opacity protein-like surface antigen
MKPHIYIFIVVIFAITIIRSGANDMPLPLETTTSPVLSDKKPARVLEAKTVDWQGLYLGANWGAAKGLTTWSKPSGLVKTLAQNNFLTLSGNDLGIFVGATAGFNFMAGPWVLGAEADFAGSNVNSYAKCSGGSGIFSTNVVFQCKSDTHRIGSAAPRLGYAFGNSLLFVKAGTAFANTKTNVSFPNYNGENGGQKSTRRYGRLFGLGYEYRLIGGWSAKVEYDYLTFNSKVFSGNYLGRYAHGASSDATIHTAKFGLNYNFGDGEPVQAQDMPSIGSDLSGEVGVRLGRSFGRLYNYLYDPYIRTRINSKLTWNQLNGVALETFFRADHTSDYFVKGFIGGLDLEKSRMFNEDFYQTDASFAAVPNSIYSNTISTARNGRALYATFDVGYDFLKKTDGKLGAFIGYNYYEQSSRAYGCAQIGTFKFDCYQIKFPVQDLILTQMERWNSMRLGLNATYEITDKVRLNGDVAWLPRSYLRGIDRHWLRADINPMIEKAHGFGNYQLEAVLSYAITEKIGLGIGARYWYFEASGHTKFPFVNTTSSEYFKSTRSTVFSQLSYIFGDTTPKRTVRD